jgi:hypothetical protein
LVLRDHPAFDAAIGATFVDAARSGTYVDLGRFLPPPQLAPTPPDQLAQHLVAGATGLVLQAVPKPARIIRGIGDWVLAWQVYTHIVCSERFLTREVAADRRHDLDRHAHHVVHFNSSQSWAVASAYDLMVRQRHLDWTTRMGTANVFALVEVSQQLLSAQTTAATTTPAQPAPAGRPARATRRRDNGRPSRSPKPAKAREDDAEPIAAGAKAKAPTDVDQPNKVDSPCSFFAKGRCRFSGTNCRYVHDATGTAVTSRPKPKAKNG